MQLDGTLQLPDGKKIAVFDVSTVNQNGVVVVSGYAEARVDD